MMIPLPPFARTRRALTIAAAFCVAAMFSGCQLGPLIYFLQPFEPKIDALGPDLRGKTVVILPTLVPGAGLDSPTVDRDLARELAKLLKEQTRRLTVVPPSKVFKWLDEHPRWNDASQAALDLGADTVIILEITDYSTQDLNSPGMFQGRSKIQVQVVEVSKPKAKDDEKVSKDEDEDELNSKIAYTSSEETLYPERGPQPADQKVTATAFRAKFLAQVAKELSWHFVKHQTTDTFQDTRFQ